MSGTTATIRTETGADAPGVCALHESAFGQRVEAGVSGVARCRPEFDAAASHRAGDRGPASRVQ